MVHVDIGIVKRIISFQDLTTAHAESPRSLRGERGRGVPHRRRHRASGAVKLPLIGISNVRVCVVVVVVVYRDLNW